MITPYAINLSQTQINNIVEQLKQAATYNIESWLLSEIHFVISNPTPHNIIYFYNDYWRSSLSYLKVSSLKEIKQKF